MRGMAFSNTNATINRVVSLKISIVYLVEKLIAKIYAEQLNAAKLNQVPSKFPPVWNKMKAIDFDVEYRYYIFEGEDRVQKKCVY